ncbi:MAG: glycoside hydrolase family 43 protein [Planctomycetota bacterium]
MKWTRPAIGSSILVVLAAVFAAAPVCAQMPDPPGQVGPGVAAKHEAYLFAHMMHGDYGRLYYSVSTDALDWKPLNGGRRVFEDYRGHPDICRGHDGRFYLVGNRNDKASSINFWVSNDLIHWARHADHTPDLRGVPDYPKAMARIGAPKLFYDEATSQYLLTWHTTHDLGKTDLPEPYWAGQRTLFATSKDLKTFSDPPRKLFAWDMATIDTIVRRIGDRYYAILKDERYPSLDWTTGKTIRVCVADHLLGPYSEPGPPVSPSFREAPMLTPSPDGAYWYLYFEQYPGVAYGLSVAKNPGGPWFQVIGGTNSDWDKYHVPTGARHGCMLTISRGEYEALLNEYR